MTQFNGGNSIHIRFRLLDGKGNVVDSRNDRYPLVTKAISMQNKNESFELQIWDTALRQYIRDERGYERIADRPALKTKEGKPQSVNTELVRQFQTVAEASRAMAASVRQGEDTAESIRDWADLAMGVLVTAGLNRQEMLEYLNHTFPKAEKTHA